MVGMQCMLLCSSFEQCAFSYFVLSCTKQTTVAFELLVIKKMGEIFVARALMPTILMQSGKMSQFNGIPAISDKILIIGVQLMSIKTILVKKDTIPRRIGILSSRV